MAIFNLHCQHNLSDVHRLPSRYNALTGLWLEDEVFIKMAKQVKVSWEDMVFTFSLRVHQPSIGWQARTPARLSMCTHSRVSNRFLPLSPNWAKGYCRHRRFPAGVRASVNFWFPSISRRTPCPIKSIFAGYVGVEERKVPFENGRAAIFNVASMAAILKLVSVDFEENALSD